MTYLVGQQSELLYFIDRAKARRPGATYAAPAVNTVGRYTLQLDPLDWGLIGSLFVADTATKAAVS